MPAELSEQFFEEYSSWLVMPFCFGHRTDYIESVGMESP